MKLTLDKALSLVAVSVISVLGSAQAAPVYEIVNLDQYDFVGEGKGTLEGTLNGYATASNEQNELVGVSKGRRKLDAGDIDDDLIDFEDAISPEEEITYSINKPIIANNFVFTAAENAADGAWVPTFDSLNGTTPPKDSDLDDPTTINSVDSYYYGINNAGLKVGSMTAPEVKVPYTGESPTQEFWYIRDYELRGVVKNGDTELALLPPYTTYVKDEQSVNLGGWSVATSVNDNNLVVGYASTDINNFGKKQVDKCIDATTYPLDVCVQNEQYPNSQGARNIQYQIRGYVWQLVDNVVTGSELPLGMTPPSDSTGTYVAQALGVNNQDTVVGRSNVYRNGDSKKLALDAAYWTKNDEGQYEYHWVPVINNDVNSSIAYDINENGILVGSYSSYIQGYIRDKFFYFDTTAADAKVVVPNDFYSALSDLASKPRDINDKGQVVGNIEITHDKGKPRPKSGFLFDLDSSEFNDINNLLICESKGFVKNADDSWTRNVVTVTDGTGKELTYQSDIKVVEANSISEDGTIVGTAFIRKPRYQFIDDKLVLGENGLPLFELNGYGDAVTSYLPRMVVLKPSSSGIACTVDDNTDTIDYERKGAASFAWLLALPFLWFRRRSR